MSPQSLLSVFILFISVRSQWICDDTVTECQCFDHHCSLDITYHNVSIADRHTPSLICNQTFTSGVTESTDCVITCNSTYSCSNTSITSIGTHTTLIDCVSTHSCLDNNINFLSSQQSQSLNQYTAGVVCHTDSSCNNATIFCDKLSCHLYCQSPDSCLVCCLCKFMLS